MHRRHLAVITVVALIGLTGCTGVFGPESVDSERLNANASYDWETETNVTFRLNRTSYTAIHSVDNNSTLTVYNRDGLGRDQDIPISALRFQYSNGTVVSSATADLSANRTGQATILQLPGNVTGQVAYTAPRNGKSFSTPVFRDNRTYSVALPPSARIGIPLLSQATPGRYSTSVDGETNRMTVRWTEPVTAPVIRVRYYLERDLLIFGAITIVAIIIGAGGTLYYWRQLQEVKRRRKDAGIDIEEEDDPTDRGPPPGMP
jgi:hypothetical protein